MLASPLTLRSFISSRTFLSAYQTSEQADQTGHRKKWNSLFWVFFFLLKIHYCPAYSLRVKWSGLTVWIKNKILFTTKLISMPCKFLQTERTLSKETTYWSIYKYGRVYPPYWLGPRPLSLPGGTLTTTMGNKAFPRQNFFSRCVKKRTHSRFIN